MENARELLVDDHHGVYMIKELVERYPLYSYKGDLHEPEEFLEGDECEAWDHIQGVRGIYVKDNEDRLWSVEFEDGGIWAFHPDAVYNEETDAWELTILPR
jgi:hypothetical protein